MKKQIFFFLGVLFVFVISCQEENNIELHTADLSKCLIELSQPQVVNHIETVEGDILESQEALTKLIEIKINFQVNDSGNFFIHKNIPKLMVLDDDAVTIINAIAVAIKFTNPETGKLIEKYHNEATMLTKTSPGDKIDYFAVFEVPETMQKYQLMLQSKLMEQVQLKTKENEKH